MCMCGKCTKVCGTLFLVVGILYLLTDLNYIAFWSLNWWTVGFLLAGIGGLASSKCPECQKGKKK